MSNKTPSGIVVPVTHPLQMFLKNARQAYRRAFPDETKRPGRPSEFDQVKDAVKAIFLNDRQTSVRRWSQERWANEIYVLSGISKRTVNKHLKEILTTAVFPIHMIPVSFVKTLPLKRQHVHWHVMAIDQALSNRKAQFGSTISIHQREIYDLYEKLLLKHGIPRLRKVRL